MTFWCLCQEISILTLLPPIGVSAWTTLIQSPLMISSPKKWCFPAKRGEKSPWEVYQQSAHMRSDENWETQTIPRKVLFLVFSTEMTVDRSTWETSCICPPFTETGVTRAERAPISDTPCPRVGVRLGDLCQSIHWTSTCWAEKAPSCHHWSLRSSLVGYIDNCVSKPRIKNRDRTAFAS